MQFNIRSTAELHHELLTSYVESEYGLISCNVPVQVYPPLSNRLRVLTIPEFIHQAGVNLTFTIVTEDSSNGVSVNGPQQS